MSNIAKKILVVDDEPDIVEYLRFVLEGAGYEITTALDGQQALKSIEAARPDLVLLDQMMPLMEGSEVLRRLKADEQTKDIPVVMLTAQDSAADMMKGWQSGTDLYLLKPIMGAELVDYINCILA